MKKQVCSINLALLSNCLLILVISFFQLRNYEISVSETYTRLMQNAIQGFSVYKDTSDISDYWEAVASYGAAVNLLLTTGEGSEIYKERHTLTAIFQLLSSQQQWENDEIESLISALMAIANNPSRRSSYAMLLDFYNTSCSG